MSFTVSTSSPSTSAREHPVDISPLANAFYWRPTAGTGGMCKPSPCRDEIVQFINGPEISELKNCVERMVILSVDPQISLGDLPDAVLRNATGCSDKVVSSRGAAGQSPQRTLVRIEHQVILDELLKCEGNVKQTAQSLGIARSTLYRKLKQIHHSAPDRAGSD